jgi:hypothetical protein
MKRAARGTSLIYVLMVIIFFTGLIYLSLTRAQLGHDAVRARYLTGVALDLAENGVELQRYLLGHGRPCAESAPCREDAGDFAGAHGEFSSFARPLPNGDHLAIATGELRDRRGRVLYSLRVQAQLSKDPSGQWKATSWTEGQTPN